MMKRYINMPLKKALPLLFICAIVLVAVSGCTTQNTTQSAGNGSGGQSSGSPISVSVVPLGTSMQVGQYQTPTSGNEYVSYNVSVKDNNVNGLFESPDYFTLRTSDGHVYDVDSAMYDSSVHAFTLISSAQPGDLNSGTVIYQIPTTATPASITYNDELHQITTTL
jgi:hypothetical protein